MSVGKIAVGSGKKLVWCSDPYKRAENVLTEFVGREHEMRLITAAWIAGERSLPLSPLLVGEPGVGKNRLVEELARRTGRPLFIFQGHEDVTAEDLACAARFGDDGNRSMDYIVSPLVTAMHSGGICFIDEIGKIRPKALALLVSVLDERRYVDSTLLGERVYAAPGFRFVAATNTGEVNSLPEFIRSRMRPVIQMGFPPQKEIDEIIKRQFPSQRERIGPLLDAFWALWDKRGGETRYPSPRDALHLFALATSLSDYDTLGGDDRLVKAGGKDAPPFALDAPQGVPQVKPEHLEQAFGELFGKEAK